MAKLPAIKIKSMFITLNEIDEFVKNYKTDQHTVSHLKIQLEEISNMSEKFEDCQAEVETVENKTEKQCLNERSTFRKRLLETKASLLELLEQDAKEKESVSAPSYSRISKDKRFNILKLPILKSPSFNGDWQQWTSFIDDFDTMFHNNEEMANIQKFHYLKSCVEGPAKEVIQNFKTTDENYQIAYSALKARYENKSAIIQSHIRSLLTTSKVTTLDSSSSYSYSCSLGK